MNRTLALLVAVAVCATPLTGCDRKPKKPKPVPPVQAPPTPQEIAAEIRASLRPLTALVVASDAPISSDVSGQVLSGLRSGKAKHQMTENGKKALDIIAVDCNSALDSAIAAESWHAVVLACDALDIIEPNNVRTDRQRRRAQMEINRPKVTIKGFMTDEETNEVFVFLDVYLPQSKETVKERVREGQEFHGLRLVNIIGKEKGIKMQHVESGETYEIMWKE